MLYDYLSKVKKFAAIICLFGLCLGQGYGSTSKLNPDEQQSFINQPIPNVPTIPKCILIVDDNDIHMQLSKKTFMSFGCTIFEAKDREQALFILKTKNIDSVISDINMPTPINMPKPENMNHLEEGLIFLSQACPLYPNTRFNLNSDCDNFSRNQYQNQAQEFRLNVNVFDKKDIFKGRININDFSLPQ